MPHIPVLLNEAMQCLNPKEGNAFIDATINGGGHAQEILKRMSPGAILLGIDRDEERISKLKEEIRGDKRLKLVVENFKNIENIAKKYSHWYDGILFDLGMSSLQLKESGRGFSFQKDEPLLMTYEKKPSGEYLTAAKIVNTWPEPEIKKILQEFGEERYAGIIAKGIVQTRKKSRIISTKDLLRVIERVVPAAYRRSRIHPATRTFQALRIVVNDELSALESALSGAWHILQKNGRIVVISFHSLEDRIAKNFFREFQKENGEIITKKPLRPSTFEVTINPRARSAKLRAIIKR